ncbi:hypothetical protein Gpo141_00015245, partial [Globisporangium polare]
VVHAASVASQYSPSPFQKYSTPVFAGSMRLIETHFPVVDSIAQPERVKQTSQVASNVQPLRWVVELQSSSLRQTDTT